MNAKCLLVLLALPVLAACEQAPAPETSTEAGEGPLRFQYARESGTTPGGYPLPLTGKVMATSPVIVKQEGVTLKQYPEYYFIAPTDGGRFRLKVDGRISWKIFNDFVVGFNVTERYDTEPPSADAGRDFHYAVTIWWSWG